MTSDSCQKLVVVLGPADPVLESTLVFVGLHVVHTAGNVTVWAPLEWNLSWPAAVVDSDVWPGSLGWDDIRCATSDQSRDVRRKCAVAEQIDSPVRELEPAWPLAVSVEEAGGLLGVSRDLVYDMVVRRELVAVRLGRRIVVPVQALEGLLGRAVEGAAG